MVPSCGRIGVGGMEGVGLGLGGISMDVQCSLAWSSETSLGWT